MVEEKITCAGTLYLDCSGARSFAFGIEYADGLRQCLEHFFGLHLRELVGRGTPLESSHFLTFACGVLFLFTLACPLLARLCTQP